MKRAGRKLIGMAAAWLLAAYAFSMTVYAADGFSSEYERLLDTAYLLSDEETDEINELLDGHDYCEIGKTFPQVRQEKYFRPDARTVQPAVVRMIL